ncbi:hypothetical protein ACU635_10315 [[Actinomadura] parvosata]|uniref:hypothetical protein n=1 Tax=[Actinomadura] parvosata TaxID=1955412 RepID=UPI00406CE1FA
MRNGAVPGSALFVTHDEDDRSLGFAEELRAGTRAVASNERHGARRADERMCRFPQGFELARLEYARPLN